MNFKAQVVSFSIGSESEIVKRFHEAISKIHAVQKIDFLRGSLLSDLQLAYTEGVANAIRHGQELKKRAGVSCRLRLAPKYIEVQILDHGRGFGLKQIPVPKFKKMTESGRGVFMMRQLMDQVAYKKGKRHNTLVLRRLLPGLDRSARELDLLYEISNAFLEKADLTTICNLILDKLVLVFGVDRASILLFNKTKKRLQVIASRGLGSLAKSQIEVRPGEGISGFVFQHAKPCLIEDMGRNQSGWKQKKKYKTSSFLSAPLVASPLKPTQETMGVINLTDRADGKSFTKKDLRLLTTIANQASAYLHMLSLWRQVREADHLRQEVEMARRVQESYLPRVLPHFQGWSLEARCRTAQSVGGDFYDFIERPEGLYFIIADVSGHNLKASMTLVNLRSRLQTLMLQEEDPGQLLTRLNRAMHSDLEVNEQFISLVLGFVTSEGVVKLACAGHPIPLIQTIDGSVKAAFPVESSGSLLGVIENETYLSNVVQLKLGEALFLYTDGVVEAANANGERFGLERLKKILEKNPKPFLAVGSELHAFSPLPSDDVTLVWLSRNSVRSESQT